MIQKKQPRQVFTSFKKYNSQFQDIIIPKLIQQVDEINLNGIMLILVNGNLTHLKKKENTRLLFQFALAGVPALKKERESLGSEFDVIAAHYYDVASRFVLNDS